MNKYRKTFTIIFTVIDNAHFDGPLKTEVFLGSNPEHSDIVELGKKDQKDYDNDQGKVERGPVKSWTMLRMPEVEKGPSVCSTSAKRSYSHDGPPRKMFKPYRGGCCD